jgi:large subunit ribosomal protein L29
MKPKEIRDMTTDEAERKIKELKENLFKIKMKLSTKQNENTSPVKIMKRDIARLLTIIKEKKAAGLKEAVKK